MKFLSFLTKPSPSSGMSPRIDEDEALLQIRKLLKDATQTKQNGDIAAAIELLRTAYALMDKSNYGSAIQERLRLPMYLQQAKKSDEAWYEFNQLVINCEKWAETPFLFDDYSAINDKMRLFLQKEGRKEG